MWLFAQELGKNDFELTFEKVLESGATGRQDGFIVRIKYSGNFGSDLQKALRNIESGYFYVPVRWNVNGEEKPDEASVELYYRYDYEAGYETYGGELEGKYYTKAPGKYTVKFYAPEKIRGTVAYEVWDSSGEFSYGTYDDWDDAEKKAEETGGVPTIKVKEFTCEGEKEVDLGTIELGGKKTPPPEKKPPEKEPIWYPGKFLKKLLGRG